MTGSVKTDPAVRFSRKYVVTDGGCWVWTASLNRSGYALFYDGQKMVIAHRWAYQQMVAPIPADLETDHLCRVRECVNPAHLEPVTKAENVRRGYASRPPKARCKHGHDFTPENTYIKPNGFRACRTCKRGA
jgi:hypothetical protein